MEYFILLNWSCCITTSLILVLSIRRDRSLLVKPSIIVVLFFNIMIQWAAVINSIIIYKYLPDPWSFALLSQGYPLIGVIVSLMIARKASQDIWKRVLNKYQSPKFNTLKAIWILSFLIVIILLYYLSNVPLRSSGLWAIFYNPMTADISREYSFKLVNSVSLKYAFSFMSSAFAALLSVLILQKLISSIKPLNPLKLVVSLIGIIGILLIVSPTGARGYAATIILIIFLSLYFKKGAPINIFYIIAGALAVLALPTILTVLRENRVLNWGNYIQTLETGIAGRVFYLPMLTGLWYVHYAQINGCIGVAAIPKLASILGQSSIDAQNMIGLIYAPEGLSTVNANTCYVFAYYSYFGILSFPFSLLGLWLLDAAIVVYRRIDDGLLLACVASVSVACTAFVSTDYTKVFLSNGLAVILITALILNSLCSKKRKKFIPRQCRPDPRLIGRHYLSQQ